MLMPVTIKKHQPSAPSPQPLAVFIGRFQPFHIGHLDAFSRMRRETGRVKILIGSSNRSRTLENPLTYAERRGYIRSVLGPDVPVTPLPDHPSDDVWLERLRRHLGPGAVVYSGNEWVKGICREAGIPFKEITYSVDVSATRIRSMIAAGDESYLRLVPGKPLPEAIFSVLRS